ncbi:hypothetical protein NA56DRAFT_584741 [Hyaloscypha hepaticicola]|uniref:CENP-V/GFA domain-containing protein n=1 Tax=Hyaloscypha hepaticicola TaxID=2082293 RepID=A0A2J6PIZ1_9HELO|nr:hypothetical protein NA56DRAFT_584741 [Hyaloscypha hepaticicola]
MPSGGCFCDKIRVSFTGEPNAKALCHCLDCRKISGATFSNNLIVPEDNFKLESGKPKEISKTADSGNKITSHFCPDCGTTLFRTGDSFPGAVVIKAGILDDKDFPNNNVPGAELFVGHRVQWNKEVDGAAQLPSMP